MSLPFTVEQFHDVFRDYNRVVWPAQWLLVALALAALAAALRSRPWSGVLVSASLGFLWAWIAFAYHVAFFSRINPVSYGFAALSAAGGGRVHPAGGGSAQARLPMGAGAEGRGWRWQFLCSAGGLAAASRRRGGLRRAPGRHPLWPPCQVLTQVLRPACRPATTGSSRRRSCAGRSCTR